MFVRCFGYIANVQNEEEAGCHLVDPCHKVAHGSNRCDLFTS